jgi:dTDP-4-amino-4,6-dideoxygalactose transaminase
MVETSAVVGLTQLRRVDEFVHKRNLIADRYKAKLSSKLFLPPVNEDTKMTWWQYIIILPKSFSRQDRENFAKELLEKYKIPTANAYWPACHDQPAFKFYVNPDQQYKNANDILDRHLSLPMYFEMELEQVDYISKSINELL